MSRDTIMAYSNYYPILSYREDDVNDVPNVDCNLDSYDFLGIVHNFKNINMSLIMVNIRSCRSNFDPFVIFLKNIDFKFNIIILTETWVPVECEEMYVIYYYYSFSVSRSGRGGG